MNFLFELMNLLFLLISFGFNSLINWFPNFCILDTIITILIRILNLKLKYFIFTLTSCFWWLFWFRFFNLLYLSCFIVFLIFVRSGTLLCGIVIKKIILLYWLLFGNFQHFNWRSDISSLGNRWYKPLMPPLRRARALILVVLNLRWLVKDIFS